MKDINRIIEKTRECIGIGEKIGSALNKGGISYCQHSRAVCPGSDVYCDSLDDLLPLMKPFNQVLFERLISERKNLILPNTCVNPYSFGAIQALLFVFILSNRDIVSKYKIFISHASKDKDIISPFVDKILTLGCKIDEKDIYCTSIDGLGIKTGDDFREHIKRSLQLSDFVFLMVSQSYKQSEVCLNEMGAAWALEKRVIPIIIDEINFNEMGLLYQVKQGMKIKDDARLDELHEELREYYGIKQDMRTWNRHKREFIANT